MKTTKWLLALAMLVSGACEFDIANPNSPDPLGTNPSREQIQNAVTGLLAGSRVDYADWVLEAGIVGREAYRFDASDPRWIDELLVGPFDPGNIRFGGDHWLEQFRNIRAGHTLFGGIGTATALSPEEKNAARGFVKTTQAVDLMMVLSAHSQDAIPIDVDRDPVADPPAPFVTNEAAWAYVVAVLDSGLTFLGSGGSAFPFQLTAGFAGFNTPATFVKFNRAIRARVEVYRGSLVHAACGAGGATCYTRALTILNSPDSTFLSTTGSFDLGVYHVYGTGSGDLANPLFQDAATANQLAHPSIRTDVETNTAGQRDRRFTTKVDLISPARSAGEPTPLSSDLVWIRYASPLAPVPIIRNEELILLKAEAENALGVDDQGLGEVNAVRQTAGGLDPILLATWTAMTLDQRLDRILKERRYSLLFEGGHRWIDARRTNKLSQIPIDRPPDPSEDFVGDRVHARWPIPLDVCLARGISGTLCP